MVQRYHSVAEGLLTMVSLSHLLEASVLSLAQIYSDVLLGATVWKGLGASAQPELSLGRQV